MDLTDASVLSKRIVWDSRSIPEYWHRHSVIVPQPLRPVEIGYMLRGGDTNHALLVMGVDLCSERQNSNCAAIPEPSTKKDVDASQGYGKEWLSKKQIHAARPQRIRSVSSKESMTYLFCTHPEVGCRMQSPIRQLALFSMGRRDAFACRLHLSRLSKRI